MHFPSTAAALSFLAMGVDAAALKREANDPHIVDFRSFGAPGCELENQGIWTFTQSQLTGCKTFASFGAEDVQAIMLIDITAGCSLAVFKDEICSEGKVVPMDAGACVSEPTEYRSFLITC